MYIYIYIYILYIEKIYTPNMFHFFLTPPFWNASCARCMPKPSIHVAPAPADFEFRIAVRFKVFNLIENMTFWPA